nr:MAG TPA: hypothetical protein [Bacteriophage sp.]
MSNTITIELCAEDRARLDHINGNLTELIMRVMGNQAPDMGEVLQKAAPELAEKLAAQHPVADPFKELPKAEPVPFEQEAPKQEAPQYKLEDIQQKVVALSASGKKAEVREIVKSYAEKVSAIPADKFGEVMAKLIGLEG